MAPSATRAARADPAGLAELAAVLDADELCLEAPDEPASDDLRSYCRELPGSVLVGAGLVVRTPDGGLVVVDPVYKAGHDLPGGMAEEGETPEQTARREVREEIGLDLPIGRLLVVDAAPQRVFDRVVLHFLYDGGTLTPDQAAGLRPHDDELGAVRAPAVGDALPLLESRVRRRTRAALRVLDNEPGARYLVDGRALTQVVPGTPVGPGAAAVSVVSGAVPRTRAHALGAAGEGRMPAG